MIWFVIGLCLGFALAVVWLWKDARRYWWVRDNPYFAEEQMLSLWDLDNAIDEEIAHPKEPAPEPVPYCPEYEYPNVRPMPGPEPLFGVAHEVRDRS